MTIWESVEAARESAHQVGPYLIGRLEYTTLQGLHFTGLWLENELGEGTQVDADKIPEGVSPQWLDLFWKENF